MKFIVLITMASLLLAGCSREGEAIIAPPLQSIQIGEVASTPEIALVPEPSLEADETVLEVDSEVSTSPGTWPDGEEKLDVQGAVEVAIIPLNLNNPTGSLNFEVQLNTHSVDLSMDLASLATLEADNGLSMEAMGWDAAAGGHHVDGVLSFPTDLGGSAFLDNASRLTLVIRDVDVPSRAFSWIATK